MNQSIFKQFSYKTQQFRNKKLIKILNCNLFIYLEKLRRQVQFNRQLHSWLYNKHKCTNRERLWIVSPGASLFKG